MYRHIAQLLLDTKPRYISGKFYYQNYLPHKDAPDNKTGRCFTCCKHRRKRSIGIHYQGITIVSIYYGRSYLNGYKLKH